VPEEGAGEDAEGVNKSHGSVATAKVGLEEGFEEDIAKDRKKHKKRSLTNNSMRSQVQKIFGPPVLYRLGHHGHGAMGKRYLQ